jgi:predicted CXXCH cytochrome family protein
MKKLLFAMPFVLALVLLSYGLALADNGPHGGFGAATDACAGCHRTHTAPQAKLLLSSSTALCQTCHGSTGTGADTNVIDGVYVNRDALAESPPEGTDGRSLKGGGFTNALMDTDDGTIAGTSTSRSATSAHTFDGVTSGTIWGNGAIGSGAGGSIAMNCSNCHNPHGKAGTNGAATYRILRARPTGSGAAADVNVADEATKNYTIASAAANYWAEPYGTLETGLTNWCSQCHTRYLAGAGSEDTNSTDPIFTYRHRSNAGGNTDGVSCTDCHVAHGTAAVMGTNSGAVAWPGGATAPNGSARSSLLRLDNRGTCYKCHTNP